MDLTVNQALRKPLSSENYDVANVNYNSDRLDERFFSTQAPIMMNVNNGSNAHLKGIMANANAMAGNRFIEARKLSDTEAFWQVDFDGKTMWGPGGATAVDTSLYRSAANTLKTDDGFWAAHASMATVEATTTTATQTATTFTDGFLSIGFTAPPSGKIKITVSCQCFMTAASTTLAEMSARVSGTAGTSTASAVRAAGNSLATPVVSSRSWIVSGLVALATGTVTVQHRRSGTGAATASFDAQSLLVEPCLN
jgi:hypothetical protein